MKNCTEINEDESAYVAKNIIITGNDAVFTNFLE